MRAVKSPLLRMLWLPGVALLLQACTTCYNERFCREMMGRSSEEVVALMGAPTREFREGQVRVLEWAHDATYRTAWLAPGHPHMWVGACGHPHVFYTPPHWVADVVPQVARLQFCFEGDRVVNFQSYFNGGGMCNFFVPPEYVARYKAEDKARR